MILDEKKKIAGVFGHCAFLGFCLGTSRGEAPRRIAGRPLSPVPHLPIFHSARWKGEKAWESLTNWNNALVLLASHPHSAAGNIQFTGKTATYCGWKTTVNDLTCIFAPDPAHFMPDVDGASIWKGPFGIQQDSAHEKRAVYSSVPLIFTFHCFVATNVWPSKYRKHPTMLLFFSFCFGNWDSSQENCFAPTFNKGVGFHSFWTDTLFEILKCIVSHIIHVTRRVFLTRARKRSPANKSAGHSRILKHLIGMKFGRGGSRGGRLSDVLCPRILRIIRIFTLFKM